MEQPTVFGTAAQQLRANPINNIGSIVEENIRYWNAVDTEEEAQRKAAELRRAEFTYKQSKDKQDAILKVVDALKVPESSGFFDYQVGGAIKARQEKLGAAAQKTSQGSGDIIGLSILGKKLEEEIKILSNLNNASQVTAERLQGKQPNPALDRKAVGFYEMITKHLHSFDNEKGKILGTNPLTGENVEYSLEEFNKTIRELDFSPVTNFNALAKTIATNIEQANLDGNISVTDDNRATAFNDALNAMSNTRTAKEYAFFINYKNSANNPSVLDTFDTMSVEELAKTKNELAKDFSENDIEKALKTTRNTLDNRLNEERIRTSRENRNKETLTYSLKTQEDGSKLIQTRFKGTNVKLGARDSVIGIGGTFSIPSNSQRNPANILATDVVRAANGQFYIAGLQEREVKGKQLFENGVPVFQEKSSFVTDKDGIIKTDARGNNIVKVTKEPVFETKTVKEDVLITDDREVSGAFLNMTDPRTNLRFTSDNVAREYFINISRTAPATNQTPTTPTTPKFNG